MNIIQTWKTKEIPDSYPHFQEFKNKIIHKHPKWNYLFFDDDDIVLFIRNNYPQYIDFFNNLPITIQKIDFFRYLAVYHYGGIYLDLDINIINDFNELYNSNKCILPIEINNVQDHILKKNNFHLLIGNYAFYAPAKHPFLKHLIDNITQNVISMDDIKIAQNTHTDNPNEVYVYHTTGPIMVSYSYNNFSDKDSVVLIKPEPFQKDCFGRYGIHCCHGTWKY